MSVKYLKTRWKCRSIFSSYLAKYWAGKYWVTFFYLSPTIFVSLGVCFATPETQRIKLMSAKQIYRQSDLKIKIREIRAQKTAIKAYFWRKQDLNSLYRMWNAETTFKKQIWQEASSRQHILTFIHSREKTWYKIPPPAPIFKGCQLNRAWIMRGMRFWVGTNQRNIISPQIVLVHHESMKAYEGGG